MFKNYLKIAWRNLKNNKASSIINIGGLAVGMTVAILIGLWIYDELSFNKSFDNYNHIAWVMQHTTSNGITTTQTSLPLPLSKELQTNYSNDFKYVVRAAWQNEHILTYGDKNLSESGNYMDADAPRMLSLKMLEGSDNGLSELNSILLSSSAAKAIFGDADPINKLIKIDDQFSVKVTGIYKDIATNTEFNGLHFIAPFSLYITSNPWSMSDQNQWDDNSFLVYVQINDKVNFNTVNEHIGNVILNHLPKSKQKSKPVAFLQPMANWHLYAAWDSDSNTTGLIEYVWLFGTVGAFVLLLACINFMNLSTAKSEKRAKEVGIRKAVGSVRSQLVSQFYCESLLVVLLAFIVAIVTAQLLLPWFNVVASKNMSMPWINPLFWLTSFAFIFITSVLAGSYPALYLSSFNPVKVLKGTFKTGGFATLPRKVLMVFQFTISLVLIIATIVVYSQVQYSKKRPIGYDRNGLLMIQMKSKDFYGKMDVLSNELKNNGAIIQMTASSSPVTNVYDNDNGYKWEGKDPNLDANFATVWVTNDFGKTVGWKLKEGRDFSREFGTDSSGVVLNEAAVKFMGLKNPVGAIIRKPNGKKSIVLGVIKDMLMESPYKSVRQTMYFLTNDNDNYLNTITLKLNPDKSAVESINKIEVAFKKYIPSAPFDYKFADTEFAAKFAAENKIGTLSTCFATLAIFISCLGLFGLASFVAEQRTKEIGVRKVLGASVFNLWNLLSKEFVLLVVISFSIAAPLSYYFMHNWLQDYPYHTKMEWWFFAAAGIGTLLITLLTVSFQSIKAAVANPVKSLRTE